MKISQKFGEHKFAGETSKEAYLSACKWIALHIISQDGVGDIFWAIKKCTEDGQPAVLLELYILSEFDKLEEDFCVRCREIHSSFFLSHDCGCNECKYRAFKEQMRNKLKIKSEYRKEQLRRT